LLAVVGLLLILNIIVFGLLFIMMMRIRNLSSNQQDLAGRISVIEEMMIELAEIEETQAEHPADELDQDESLNVDLTNETNETETLTGEQERTRRILELAHSGLSPEVIAKTTGYSNGEVRLVLNLHRNERPVR
jgi:hypothetical protein